MTDLPFKAHYTDDNGDTQCRTFATNTEAHEFRATLVDGKLPKSAPPVEDKAEEPIVEAPVAFAAVPAVPLTNDTTSKASVVPPPSATAAVLNGPKIEPSKTGANG